MSDDTWYERERQRELWRIAGEMTVCDELERRAWRNQMWCACSGRPNCCIDIGEVEQAIVHTLGVVAGVFRQRMADLET